MPSHGWPARLRCPEKKQRTIPLATWAGHDLHHAYGTKFPWTEAAYVRTRLLLN